MIESLTSSLFVAFVLSLALIKSMFFNPRRLEAFGYSFSILFFQLLIAGHEDTFFICPQFPIHISPLDEEDPDPDRSMADPRARGVFVDTALLLARCERPLANPIATTFATAYRECRLDLFDAIDITSLEVPILEERKKAPTRHPNSLKQHVQSIVDSLASAEVQVVTQGRILFASPRFADQDQVILIATAGQYYRIAFFQRDHILNSNVPRSVDIKSFLKQAALNLNPLDTDDLVASPILQVRRKEEKRRQDKARDARAAARETRKSKLADLKDDEHALSKITSQPYTDETIETYYKGSGSTGGYRCTSFFEREPLPNENLSTLAATVDENQDLDEGLVVFTGVIRVGTSVSDKYIGLIRDYLDGLAAAEKLRREE